jgi:hypothetical protein
VGRGDLTAREDLPVTGRVNYRAQEASTSDTMKARMQQHGYDCDLGVTTGSRPRPNTHGDPRAG